MLEDPVTEHFSHALARSMEAPCFWIHWPLVPADTVVQVPWEVGCGTLGLSHQRRDTQSSLPLGDDALECLSGKSLPAVVALQHRLILWCALSGIAHAASLLSPAGTTNASCRSPERKKLS